MVEQCEKVCEDFERQTEPEVIEEWRTMKRCWEQDSSKPDPFKFSEKRRFINHLGGTE